MSGHDPFAGLIAPFQRRGVDLGLERLQGALAELGHPERRFTAVQVAGTNGKGSISTMVAEIVAAAGLRCGLYTSPHLLSWCERIRLPDGLISEPALVEVLQALQPLGQRHDLTPFELITAAAFVAFAEAQVDLAVLEVGLGGRLDATTTHPRRRVLALGAIGLDHREHLGDSLAAIAAEKAGVMVAGAIAVSGPQDPAVRAVLARQAQISGCALRWVEPLAPETQGGPHLGLGGDLQRSNGAVAVGVAQALAEQGWALSGAAIQRGLERSRWPGRLERRQFQGQPLMVDGAHNPPAAVALRHELDLDLPRDGSGRNGSSGAGSRRQEGARRWLVGIQRHKQAVELLQTLLRPGDSLRVVPLPEHTSWSADELARAMASLEMAPGDETPAQGRGDSADTTVEASSGDLAADLAWLVASEALPVACGSLYLVAAVLPLLDPVPSD